MYYKTIKSHYLNLSLVYLSNVFKKRSFNNDSGLRFVKEKQPRFSGRLPTMAYGLCHRSDERNLKNAKLSVKFSTNLHSLSDSNEDHSSNCNCTAVPNENDILNQDLELRSILNDIMKDFDSTPPNPPGKKNKIASEPPNSEVGSTDVESSNDLNEKTTDGKVNFESSDDGPVASDNNIFLEELVNFLQAENLRDIAVIKVPESLAYANYLVLVTAVSYKQLKATADNICKNYKSKNLYFQVEGKDCNDWKVIDMGSIVLHMFSSDVREHYDLETLWTVGEQFDELVKDQQNDIGALVEKHAHSFSKLKLALNNQ